MKIKIAIAVHNNRQDICNLTSGFARRIAISPVADRVLAITDYACERLLEIGAKLHAPRIGSHRSGIVTFELPGRDSNEIRRRLEAANIIVRCRAGGVRISPHGYATFEEVDHMVDELNAILRSSGG